MSEFSQIDFSDILSIDWPDDSYIKFIDQYKKHIWYTVSP